MTSQGALNPVAEDYDFNHTVLGILVPFRGSYIACGGKEVMFISVVEPGKDMFLPKKVFLKP